MTADGDVETVSYAYGIVRAAAGHEETPDRPRGVGGGPVRLITEGPVSALVETVAARDFDESALRRHLEDLAWLERVARAHHAVVDAAAGHCPVLPFRLATVFLDDSRVRAMLRERAEAFHRQFHRLAGCGEWGVKVYASGAPSTPQGAPRTGGDVMAPSAGRAYLRRRRTELDARGASWTAAEDVARRLEEDVSAFARGRRRFRAQDKELPGACGDNVYNAAFLVADQDAQRLARLVQAIGDTGGARVELTGPWAPYSFADAET